MPDVPATTIGEVGLIDRATLMRQLGVTTRQTIVNYERAGMPVAVRRGHIRLYRIADVAAWMERESQPPKKRRTA